MRRSNCDRRVRSLLVLLAMLVAASVGAVELGSQVEVHGYGSQDYVQTTGNAYLGADNKGTWENNFLGLVGAVTLTDKSKLWAQLETSDTDATRFTWFFVDYVFSDAVRLHVGRVKFPTGLYNEIIDSKMLQLSSLEPAIYQTAADFVHDAYTGAGLDYEKSLGAVGRIIWQVYTGENYDPNNAPSLRDRRLLGTRVTYATPVDGLQFLLSFNHGEVEVVPINRLIYEQRLMLSADYTSGGWDFKSEYATHQFRGVNSDGYYVQAGRTFADRWTPFVRYDVVNLDRARQGDDSFTQKILVTGLGYRFIRDAVIRVEAQFNRGYGLPVASGEVAQGAGTRDWTLVVVGMHFYF
jgi:hypothetical protein